MKTKRERFKLSVSVFALFIRNDKILLLKRCNTGWMDGHFSVPAGALDENETFQHAIVREIKEEVNATVDIKDLKLKHIMHTKTEGQEWEGIYYVVTKWKGTLIINEPEKHSDLQWCNLGELPFLIIPYVKQALEMIKDKKLYSEYGWE
ncbi:NUDIX domain-containing protein [Candidatus Roizmanbacteria bacterium]|nr:NUDIX domain-containing protein [Candidatus Roizmanbacteria bacterium]